jgi:hypothetical protein
MTARPSGPDPVLYTPREAAAMLGVAVSTLGDWIRADRFPPGVIIRTVGGSRRFRGEPLRAMLDAIRRAGVMERFAALIGRDPDGAAECLTEAFPPWRVWIGDKGGWYAGSPVPGQHAGTGETLAADTGSEMRDLLTARAAS